jgi:DNA-binding transcriptional MerR regulator
MSNSGADPVATTRAGTDDPLMSIGAFSTATLVSIKALRLYHDQGLLIPAAIDQATGYRSYRVSQLVDAQVIKRLRDLDLPLSAVARVVSARDPEVTRQVIADHEMLMRERLSDLHRLVDELQTAIAQPALQTPAFVRTEPDHHVLAVSELVDDPGHDAYAEFLDRAFETIFTGAMRLGAMPTGPSGALYPPRLEGVPEVVTAFIPVAQPVVLDDVTQRAGVVNQVLPGVTGAVLTHRGSYAEMGSTYRQLGAWVASNARPIEQPVRELYVVSVDETTGKLLPAEQLVTEILWPIDATSVRTVS